MQVNHYHYGRVFMSIKLMRDRPTTTIKMTTVQVKNTKVIHLDIYGILIKLGKRIEAKRLTDLRGALVSSSLSSLVMTYIIIEVVGMGR
jgi:hypothetical protein